MTATSRTPVDTPTDPVAENVLLRPWSGPYDGVPPFGQERVEDFAPAIERAMDEHLAEIDRIAHDPEPPTFENTLAALERSGRALDRALAVYGVWSGTKSSAAFREVERALAPKLAAYQDRITQNEALFARIAAVYEARETSGLTAEQQRLVWKQYTDFVRAGARLDAAAKARLSAINQRLASLFTTFTQNILTDEDEQALVLRHESDLAGLPASLCESAAAAAAAKGMSGCWLIANTRSAMDPFLTYAERRDLREAAWRLFVNRGDAGATDNTPIIREILALRVERARLLGYATHAHWRLENAMAESPDRATALMEAVWPRAVARVRAEVADMQAMADRDGAGITIEPWDYRFYAERVRAEKYALDADDVRPYLQLEPLRDAMFWVAEQLFGLRFSPAADIPVYHPDVRVWAVSDARTGRHVGLWYFDPYAREGKRSGAWMSAYRIQERFDGEVTTIVSNNSNFMKAAAGEPVLISWDDATTLFHEFGHALHGLASHVSYPTLSGTAVARDFVEFPSQLLEHWLSTPEVLERFARHHATGAPLSPEVVDRIKRAANFNQGFATVEYLASALVDMALHVRPDGDVDPRAFERDTLARLGMPPEIVMRHRLPHFSHIFASDSYSAAYYSYLWADVITADAAEAFAEAPGGLYDRDVARRLFDGILAIGNTQDPMEAYRGFRGREPSVDALMRKRGFED